MKDEKQFVFFILLLALALAAIGYLVYENRLLDQNSLVLGSEISQTKNELVKTKNDFASTTAKLNGDIMDLNAILDSTKNDLASTTVALEASRAQYNNTVSDLSQQVSETQTKIGTLEKLSQTDPELLKKYSKVYFLNENYVPASLTKINPDYTYNPKIDYSFYTETLPFLNALMSSARAANIDIKIISAYRSFGTQSGLKSSYRVTYGTGANAFSADQGYSEHQMGTAVDFTTSTIGSSFEGFEKTPAYQWLTDMAYDYGFVLSYPKGNSYYQYEPWHWRFVGRALAQKLHTEGKNFYDVDQREIDKYLISFFD